MSNKPQINMENFEVFLMDYFDGTLSPEMTEELLAFLDSNPQLKADLDDFDSFHLNSFIEISENNTLKNSLKRVDSEQPKNFINSDNLDDYLIHGLENNLNPSETEALRTFLIMNPEAQKNAKLVDHLKLSPDKTVRFEDKNLLYKTSNLSNITLSEETAEEFIIAFCEGDLTNKEGENLKKWIAANPQWQSTMAVYQNLKLRPDYSIEFPNKERLRIRPHISWYNTVAYRYISSIAAVLVVFLYFPALINNGVMDQTIYHQPTEFQTSQPQELSSSQTLFKTDENTPSSKDDAIAEAKPAESAIKVAKKPTRNKTTLQKFSSRKPEPKLNLTSNLTPIKPNVCFASQSKTYGYYQVSLQKDNFINNNPELKKRLIKGLRKSLNINNDEIKTPDDKLTLWDLADFGAKSLSNLTETDITITRK